VRSKSVFVPLKVFTLGVLEILCSQGQHHILWGHCDLDLWPLTFSYQNLTSLSLNLDEHFYQIWRNSLKSLQRYCIHAAKTAFCEVTVTLTYDVWPPKSNQFILECKWTFVTNLNRFCQGVTEILCPWEWDRRTSICNRKQSASGPGCCRSGGIKKTKKDFWKQKQVPNRFSIGIESLSGIMFTVVEHQPGDKYYHLSFSLF